MVFALSKRFSVKILRLYADLIKHLLSISERSLIRKNNLVPVLFLVFYGKCYSILFVTGSQLNNDEFGLLLSPPCKLDLPIEELISPGNNKENLPTKSQNAFILYRKNNRKSPAIAKVAWDEESDKFSSPCTSDDTNPSSSTCSNLSTSLSPHFAPSHFNINYNNSPISSSSCTNNNKNLSSSTYSSSFCIPNSSYPQNNKLTQDTQLNNITKNATQPSQPPTFKKFKKGTKPNNWGWTNLNANVEKINKEMEQSQINQQQQYKQIDYTSDRYTNIKDSDNEYNHINNSYISVRQQPNPNQT
ncbi:11820_t:CDS:2 [Entrophospora sp. SA101]|nr:11820_t:CDS:2 [Entrophospora sp. SA101]